jgi:hypothetical protein
VTQVTRGGLIWKRRATKSLHATAFLINADQHGPLCRVANVRGKLRELRTVLVIAREQDDIAHTAREQHGLLLKQFSASDSNAKEFACLAPRLNGLGLNYVALHDVTFILQGMNKRAAHGLKIMSMNTHLSSPKFKLRARLFRRAAKLQWRTQRHFMKLLGASAIQDPSVNLFGKKQQPQSKVGGISCAIVIKIGDAALTKASQHHAKIGRIDCKVIVEIALRTAPPQAVVRKQANAINTRLNNAIARSVACDKPNA